MVMSDLLNNILNNNEKSCFKCLNFKIYNFDKKLFNFKVTKARTKCCKNKLNANSIVIGINHCDNKKNIVLSSSLKSYKRYNKIALYCDSYQAD